MSQITFTVYGVPIPQGSMKAFTPPGFHRPIVTSDNTKLKPWRQEIAGVVLQQMEENGFARAGRRVPVSVDATFFFNPHEKDRSQYKTTKPDIDKLLRALLDSLTGLIFEDDSQVVDSFVRKRYDSPARVEVTVTEIFEPLDLPPMKKLKRMKIKDQQLPF